MSTRRRPGLFPTAQHPSQWLALVVAITSLVLAVAGFLASMAAEVDFAASEGASLVGLGVNPLRCTIYLVLGFAGLSGAARLGAARAYGWVIAVVFAAALVYGALVAEDALAAGIPSNILHAILAGMGVAMAIWPVGDRFPTPDDGPGGHQEHAGTA